MIGYPSEAGDGVSDNTPVPIGLRDGDVPWGGHRRVLLLAGTELRGWAKDGAIQGPQFHVCVAAGVAGALDDLRRHRAKEPMISTSRTTCSLLKVAAEVFASPASTIPWLTPTRSTSSTWPSLNTMSRPGPLHRLLARSSTRSELQAALREHFVDHRGG